MIARRFFWPITALLLGALVPTVIHGYLDSTIDDGRRAAMVPERLGEFAATPSGARTDGWMWRVFESRDWIERDYRGPGGSVIRLSIVRSYDAKRLYHHPELALTEGIDLESAGTRPAPGTPEVTVHVLDGATGPAAAYVLLYGDRAVAHPYLFQMRLATEQLFSGRQAMTLFFAVVVERGDGGEPDAALQLLGDAVRAFSNRESAGGDAG